MTIKYIEEKNQALTAYNAILPELIAFFKTEPKTKNSGELFKSEQVKFDAIAKKLENACPFFLHAYRSIYGNSYIFKFCFQHEYEPCCEYFEHYFYTSEVNKKDLSFFQVKILSSDEIKAIENNIKLLEKQQDDIKSAISENKNKLFYYFGK